MTGLELFDTSRANRDGLFNRDRLLAAIRAAGLDAVIASTSNNVTYTSGAYLPSTLLLSTFVVTSADGAQFIVLNEADAYYVRSCSWIKDVRTFGFSPRSDQEALQLLAQGLSDLGLSGARLGIEKGSVDLEAMTVAMSHATLANGSAVFEKTRQVKTDKEIALFEAAALATAKAIAACFTLARPGDTEKSLQASMQSAVLHLGADGLAHAVVHSGVHSTVVHAHSMEVPIRWGEVIHVDFGGNFGGYKTDLSRNAVVGSPRPRQADIYRKLCEIEEMLFSQIRPGVSASTLFDVGEKAHQRAGLKYPWTTIGHSSGLAVHEGFEMSRGTNVDLESGMILQIEPSHIEDGDARYHIEDSVLVTEHGARWLSDFGREPDMFRIE